MPTSDQLAVLNRLIAATHSWDAARAFKRYHETATDLDLMAAMARELGERFPDLPGACLMMSALYGAALQQSKLPAYVVAGSLSVQGQYVFGDGRAFSGREVFGQTNRSWDGHAWVMVGDRVIDLSLFRTARSPKCPLLAQHIGLETAHAQDAYLGRWRTALTRGLGYEPQYVLSSEQVRTLVDSAEVEFNVGLADKPSR